VPTASQARSGIRNPAVLPGRGLTTACVRSDVASFVRRFVRRVVAAVFLTDAQDLPIWRFAGGPSGLVGGHLEAHARSAGVLEGSPLTRGVGRISLARWILERGLMRARGNSQTWHVATGKPSQSTPSRPREIRPFHYLRPANAGGACHHRGPLRRPRAARPRCDCAVRQRPGRAIASLRKVSGPCWHRARVRVGPSYMHMDCCQPGPPDELSSDDITPFGLCT
jgi:hypothetical protein